MFENICCSLETLMHHGTGFLFKGNVNIFRYFVLNYIATSGNRTSTNYK